MTENEFYAVCGHVDSARCGLRFHRETVSFHEDDGSVTVDARDKPTLAQEKVCGRLAQSLGGKERNLDVWLDGGIIYIADKTDEE